MQVILSLEGNRDRCPSWNLPGAPCPGTGFVTGRFCGSTEWHLLPVGGSSSPCLKHTWMIFLHLQSPSSPQ